MALVLFAVIILYFITRLAVDYSAVKKIEREGHETFLRCEQNAKRRTREFAKKYDYFSDGYSYTKDRYSDGSIRRDRFTGKQYKKGQYYYDSQGRLYPGVNPPKDAKQAPDR